MRTARSELAVAPREHEHIARALLIGAPVAPTSPTRLSSSPSGPSEHHCRSRSDLENARQSSVASPRLGAPPLSVTPDSSADTCPPPSPATSASSSFSLLVRSPSEFGFPPSSDSLRVRIPSEFGVPPSGGLVRRPAFRRDSLRKRSPPKGGTPNQRVSRYSPPKSHHALSSSTDCSASALLLGSLFADQERSRQREQHRR